MHIFIDESGNFLPSNSKPGVSLVGALTIPSFTLPRLYERYQKLRRTFPKINEEVKGRLLREGDIEKLVTLLQRNSAILEIVAIDLNIHSDEEISYHKQHQARGIVMHLTDEHHPSVRQACDDLKYRLEKMPNQLYAQSVAMFELIATTVHHTTLYYSQRWPKELGEFHWLLDAKGKSGTTNWEDWWTQVVMPSVQSKSIRNPHPAFVDGDYSHFKRFLTAVPEWLPPPDGGGGDKGIDLRLLLMEHFAFSDQQEPGLEMVDILVNAVRRAIIGHLKYEGWRKIPQLMIHTSKRQYVRLIALHDRALLERLPYESVVNKFRCGGRTMLSPRFCR